MRRSMRVMAGSAALATALTLGGCQTMGPAEGTGAVLGGIGGAVIGSQFGSGRGQLVTTALGAVVGAMAGSAIGEAMDANSRQQASAATHTALNRGMTGQTVAWENPGNRSGPAYGTTEVTRVGTNDIGEPCREYVQTVTIGTETEQVVGRACQGRDGAWRDIGMQ